jgi:hypothetical protein
MDFLSGHDKPWQPDMPSFNSGIKLMDQTAQAIVTDALAKPTICDAAAESKSHKEPSKKSGTATVASKPPASKRCKQSYKKSGGGAPTSKPFTGKGRKYLTKESGGGAPKRDDKPGAGAAEKPKGKGGRPRTACVYCAAKENHCPCNLKYTGRACSK